MTILSILLAATALFVTAMLTAPEGYEDEAGFHYGKDPHNDPVSSPPR